MSKGIALCGKEQFQDAMEVFDFASMFTNGDLNTIHFLLLIKAGLIDLILPCFIFTTISRQSRCSMQINMTRHYAVFGDLLPLVPMLILLRVASWK
jgi:hypothetical protein